MVLMGQRMGSNRRWQTSCYGDSIQQAYCVVFDIKGVLFYGHVRASTLRLREKILFHL